MSEVTPAQAARIEAKRAAEKLAHLRTAVPSLHLMIWPTPDCLQLSLVMYYSRPGMRRTCTVLRSAQWRPGEVTQTLLVEWGRRALADWLANPTETEVGDTPFAFGKGKLGG